MEANSGTNAVGLTAVDIHKRSVARALRALELRQSGLTFREIGEAMGGLSVETARQAVKKGQRIQERRSK